MPTNGIFNINKEEGGSEMRYVITQADKRKQRDFLYQLWRFAALSLRFFRLTQLECRLARSAREKSVGVAIANNG